MEKDFHYYCIAVLARAAGFSEKHAFDMAYASQYVDDSTENRPIQVGDLVFDPVRTAHIGLDAFNWSVQKRVYIPFHFIPPKTINSTGDTYITSPVTDFSSCLAKDIFDEASKEDNLDLRIIRLGVALHTFADTWAHQGFSGRFHEENDVEDIHVFFNDEYHYLIWENISYDLAPEIGHAEVRNFADQPYLKWKCTVGNRSLERDNPKEFMEAAKTIYDELRNINASNPFKTWDEIKKEIEDLLKKEGSVSDRCNNWMSAFNKSFFPRGFKEYNKLEWREKALESRNVDWDTESSRINLMFSMTEKFWESKWVLFHRAALKQRHYVLERIF